MTQPLPPWPSWPPPAERSWSCTRPTLQPAAGRGKKKRVVKKAQEPVYLNDLNYQDTVSFYEWMDKKKKIKQPRLEFTILSESL